MADTWVIFGATGQQGGAVARALLQDPTLSKSISVRSATRDPSSSAATTLRDLGCEIVRADLNDKASVESAVRGATGIFLATTNDMDEDYYEREFRQGKNVADAAVAAGVHKIVFSTLPSVKNITNGHLTKVVHFDVKYDIEQYTRQLPIESCFVALGAFMQNFTTVLRPQDRGDGTFAIKTSMPSSTLLPLVDATDIGPVTTQIIKDFDDYRDRTINLATQLTTVEEAAALIGTANAKTVKYVQISSEEFLAPVSKAQAEDWAEFAVYLSDYGYFGPEMKTMEVGEFEHLTTFEEFLKDNIKLTE